jgi:hypothetical protein
MRGVARGGRAGREGRAGQDPSSPSGHLGHERQQFVDEIGPGKEGRWKAAVEELVAAGLIGPIGMSPYKLYLITEKGARAAESAATRPVT